MKFLLLTLLLFASLTSAQAPTPAKTFASHFQHFASIEKKQQDYYLNEVDVIRKGSQVQFWGIVIGRNLTMLTHFTGDCNTYEYSQEGRVKIGDRVTDYAGVLEPAVRGTVIYAALEKICGMKV